MFITAIEEKSAIFKIVYLAYYAFNWPEVKQIGMFFKAIYSTRQHLHLLDWLGVKRISYLLTLSSRVVLLFCFFKDRYGKLVWFFWYFI